MLEKEALTLKSRLFSTYNVFIKGEIVMTHQEARDSGKPYNRKKYKDGWYYTDDRGLSCHSQDLSLRLWKDEDLVANDWIIKEEKQDLNSNY